MIERLKSWVLSWKLVQHEVLSTISECERKFIPILEEAKRQGSIDAFSRAHTDIMETMRDDLDKQAEELAEKKLAALLSPIEPSRIVRIDRNLRAVFIGEERAEEGRLSNLKAEAEFFVQSELWKLIYETPKELAQNAMFVSGESLADMNKGRSMLFTLATQKKIIDTFKSYTPKS